MCCTRTPKLAAVFCWQTFGVRYLLNSCWWMGAWFTIMQNNLYGLHSSNKARSTLAVSCKKNDKYRHFIKFHHDGETIGRGRYWMHYEILYFTSLHFSFRNLWSCFSFRAGWEWINTTNINWKGVEINSFNLNRNMESPPFNFCLYCLRKK